MDTFSQVKNTVMEAAKEAKDKVVEIGQEAKELVQGMADKLTGPGGDQPDALKLLKTDHELVAGLFTQLNASESSEQTRDGLFAQLKYELETHAEVEERLFYPAVEQATKADQLIRQALADHAQIKSLLKEQTSLSSQSSGWLSKLDELKQVVERHVQMEENELFKIARQAFSEEQLQELGRCITIEKDASTAEGKPGTQAQPVPPSAGKGTGKSPGKGTKKSAQRVSH